MPCYASYSGKPHILHLPEVRALIVDLGLVRCAASLSVQRKRFTSVCTHWPIVRSLRFPRVCCNLKNKDFYVYKSNYYYPELPFDWD